MRKYLTTVFIFLAFYLMGSFLFFYQTQIYLPAQGPLHIFTGQEGGKLLIDEGQGLTVFDLRGVNLGLGIPGHFATDYAIDKETYLTWFAQIQDMGANVIRNYTLAHADFYEAFYDYNLDNPDPLYLIQGVWVDDYLLHSYRSAFDPPFYEDFSKSCRQVVDTVHGRHSRFSLGSKGPQSYRKDVSPWVYGYIVGVEWEGDIVAYTNQSLEARPDFKGKYLQTDQAQNFEIFLAQVGEDMIAYETSKYGCQRALAFSNWPATDPFVYPDKLSLQFNKFASLDVDRIKASDNFSAGLFASYHLYPYYPEYMRFVDPDIDNSYKAYVKKLNDHHRLPVIVSEFGLPSSRGWASYEENRALGRDQGALSEVQQGQGLVSLYEDIMAAGSAGGIVFIWQDEWFKRTWNTMPFVDLDQVVFWGDVETNEQYFGLLSFDPGQDASLVYVDGDGSEWTDADRVLETPDFSLSMNYDEKYIYFLVQKKAGDISQNPFYLALDVTPQSGTRRPSKGGLKTSRPSDFIVEIKGKEESRIWVQERYDRTRAIFGQTLEPSFNPYRDPPAKDSPRFNRMNSILHEVDFYDASGRIPFSEFRPVVNESHYLLSQFYETGKLTYGQANPQLENFNSLADFSFGPAPDLDPDPSIDRERGLMELRLPWSLLNFSDPSGLRIHDDYYDNYGVEHMKIEEIYVGLGSRGQTLDMAAFALEPLGRRPATHERLKESYYILQEAWQSRQEGKGMTP